jgi:Nucleotidyl transferase AbiEii toxin, Type IV TA system
VLKGAIALDFRFAGRSRTTKDMDLVRFDGEREATADLLAAQDVDLGDFFTFVVDRTDKLQGLIGGAAVRYHVAVDLAGRRFDEATVDVGFGGPVIWEPQMVEGPRFLEFAGVQAIHVPTLPIEQHVAEKVHAYTRGYETGGSTRPKDLIDLVLLRDSVAFTRSRLREALEATFAFRGTHSLPDRLPPPPSSWGIPYRTMAEATGIDGDLNRAYRRAAGFLDPIFQEALPAEAYWDPGRATWS